MAGQVIRTSPSAEPSHRHKWLVVLACILSIAGLLFFVSHRYYSFTKPIDGTIWGEFGDFIGGVVGTIIAYISIRLLIDTLKAQKDANDISLESAQESLYVYRVQQFNYNFQMLIQLYRESLNQFKEKEDKDCKGQEFLKNQAEKCRASFEPKEADYATRKLYAVKRFNEFYNENRDEASVYFRIIYRLLELLFDTKLYRRDKLKYAKILRSQFSEAELFFIRYNAMTENGKNMRFYLCQYNILKHLPALNMMEFSYWRYKKITSSNANLVITYLIALSKSIKDHWTWDEENFELEQIKGRYEVKDTIENPSKYVLEISRKQSQQSEDDTLSKAFDGLTRYELRDFFADFITEMFSYYSFEQYQKLSDIEIVPEEDIKDDSEFVKITVSSTSGLIIYEEKDTNIIIESESEYDIV